MYLCNCFIVYGRRIRHRSRTICFRINFILHNDQLIILNSVQVNDLCKDIYLSYPIWNKSWPHTEMLQGDFIWCIHNVRDVPVQKYCINKSRSCINIVNKCQGVVILLPVEAVLTKIHTTLTFTPWNPWPPAGCSRTAVWCGWPPKCRTWPPGPGVRPAHAGPESRPQMRPRPRWCPQSSRRAAAPPGIPGPDGRVADPD